ncbi:MAG TPA: succinylglutamate desuccinylase/aspartoacylase family protein [Gammaproteobacteria bacterium]|nr:succinylglutamate desuccinylase/aspartoacylase family protein [Gammaproteobacteria bacterium]HET7587810.1 succinylglutamate desuccinylase/aspartoacylase family protein [Gammaproteobacteria bacterium]
MKPLTLAGTDIAPGSRVTLHLPLGQLYTHNPISMPVHVIHGRRPGPCLFVSAAIHGDELNGIEIIRRLLVRPALNHLRGTLLAVPIVNVLGVLEQSRYLPDRRDLNRSFPGTEKGSLAARHANLFMTEIVAKANYGIDLHTGALNRSNLPQIRANLDDAETRRLAEAFGTPVILNSDLREGSLREVAAQLGITMLLYEAGEALRFDELSIRAGVRGIINVMRAIGMLPPSRSKQAHAKPALAAGSTWVRAPVSGVARFAAGLGAWVKKGELLGRIADPFGEQEEDVVAPFAGLVIGCTNIPLVYEGDAMFHLAHFDRSRGVATRVEAFRNGFSDPA